MIRGSSVDPNKRSFVRASLISGSTETDLMMSFRASHDGVSDNVGIAIEPGIATAAVATLASDELMSFSTERPRPVRISRKAEE